MWEVLAWGTVTADETECLRRALWPELLQGKFRPLRSEEEWARKTLWIQVRTEPDVQLQRVWAEGRCWVSFGDAWLSTGGLGSWQWACWCYHWGEERVQPGRLQEHEGYVSNTYFLAFVVIVMINMLWMWWLWGSGITRIWKWVTLIRCGISHDCDDVD